MQLGPSTNYVTCKQNGCARLPQFAGLFLLLPMSDYCQNTDHSLTWEGCGEDKKCQRATSTVLCQAGPVLEGSDELFNRQCPLLAPSVRCPQMVWCVCGRNELKVCTMVAYSHIYISSFRTMPVYSHKHTHTRFLKPFEDATKICNYNYFDVLIYSMMHTVNGFDFAGCLCAYPRNVMLHCQSMTSYFWGSGSIYQSLNQLTNQSARHISHKQAWN